MSCWLLRLCVKVIPLSLGYGLFDRERKERHWLSGHFENQRLVTRCEKSRPWKRNCKLKSAHVVTFYGIEFVVRSPKQKSIGLDFLRVSRDMCLSHSLTFWQSRFKSAHVALWLCEVVDRALHSWVTSIQNLEAFELYRDQQFLLFRVRRDDFSNWLVCRSLWKWSVTVLTLLSIAQ